MEHGPKDCHRKVEDHCAGTPHSDKPDAMHEGRHHRIIRQGWESCYRQGKHNPSHTQCQTGDWSPGLAAGTSVSVPAIGRHCQDPVPSSPGLWPALPVSVPASPGRIQGSTAKNEVRTGPNRGISAYKTSGSGWYSIPIDNKGDTSVNKRILRRLLSSAVVLTRKSSPSPVPVPAFGRHCQDPVPSSLGLRPALPVPVPAYGRRTGSSAQSALALCVAWSQSCCCGCMRGTGSRMRRPRMGPRRRWRRRSTPR